MERPAPQQAIPTGWKLFTARVQAAKMCAPDTVHQECEHFIVPEQTDVTVLPRGPTVGLGDDEVEAWLDYCDDLMTFVPNAKIDIEGEWVWVQEAQDAMRDRG